jgi:hypothetical protein
MVERPIKKADRQPKPEGNETTPNAKRSDDSDKNRSTRSGGGKDKRDKRGSRDEEVKQPVNLALMRGPKPTKPQPVEEVIPEELSAVAEESTLEETTEA